MTSPSRTHAVQCSVILGAALTFCAVPAFAFSDAEIVALELSGQLLAPPELVAQVDADLTSIRQYEPYFSTLHVLPEWEPGVLVVGLSISAWQLYLGGQYHGLDALNAQYGPVQITAFAAFRTLRLTFSRAYNPVLLSPIYAAAEGVILVEPSFSSDGDDISAAAVGSYRFKHGWDDCPSLCASKHFWDFTVTNGVVSLVGESGDEFGACCIFDGPCIMTTPEECPGGFVGGLCTPNPCAVATEPVRWGHVKAAYR